jgi:hypothetical protein
LERELSNLVIAAGSGEASDEQLTRMDELVGSDASLANFAARLFDQQAALSWQGAVRGELFNPDGEQLVSAMRGDTYASRRPLLESVGGKRQLAYWTMVASSIAFILGGLTAGVIYRANVIDSNNAQAAAASADRSATHPAYEARLIQSTACLWEGGSMSTPAIGSGLTSGESLHLLEGLAEFTLNWSGQGEATLSLEGPAAMMLTSEGMPTLRFGRLSAKISTITRPFVLETPIGRLSLSEPGSIGISSYGNEGEVHIFSGAATFEPAWRSPEQTSLVSIDAGQSIRIQTGENGEPTTSIQAADPEYFAAQVSMESDRLSVPASYVETIKGARPVGYWRFERDEWPSVPNQMGPKLSCHVNGMLGRATHQANQAVEFGVRDQDGEIVSDDLMDDTIRDSYSVEFWIKPSHYHVGAVISLLGDTPTSSGILPHGLLVELGGTGKIPTSTHHPGCVRFLHRSPASNDSQVGTSCYSNSSYTLRKWQHVVAVKDKSQMRLYINGQLEARGEDSSELPPGLRMVIGNLYPSRHMRRFIGQLDELAIYNRALGETEISNHYRLVRPLVESGVPSI